MRAYPRHGLIVSMQPIFGDKLLLLVLISHFFIMRKGFWVAYDTREAGAWAGSGSEGE